MNYESGCLANNRYTRIVSCAIWIIVSFPIQKNFIFAINSKYVFVFSITFIKVLKVYCQGSTILPTYSSILLYLYMSSNLWSIFSHGFSLCQLLSDSALPEGTTSTMLPCILLIRVGNVFCQSQAFWQAENLVKISNLKNMAIKAYSRKKKVPNLMCEGTLSTLDLKTWLWTFKLFLLFFFGLNSMGKEPIELSFWTVFILCELQTFLILLLQGFFSKVVYLLPTVKLSVRVL